MPDEPAKKQESRKSITSNASPVVEKKVKSSKSKQKEPSGIVSVSLASSPDPPLEDDDDFTPTAVNLNRQQKLNHDECLNKLMTKRKEFAGT